MGHFYYDILGVSLIALGAFRYDDVAGWGFAAVIVGFFAIAWVFNALRDVYNGDDKKIIFSMSGVTKTFQSANTPVLKNISQLFLWSKNWYSRLNGSGKSTLLKIIAGVDKNYQGDVVFSQDYSVGYLEQEPQLDDEKTVLDVVKEGAAETTNHFRRVQ